MAGSLGGLWEASCKGVKNTHGRRGMIRRAHVWGAEIVGQLPLPPGSKVPPHMRMYSSVDFFMNRIELGGRIREASRAWKTTYRRASGDAPIVGSRLDAATHRPCRDTRRDFPDTTMIMACEACAPVPVCIDIRATRPSATVTGIEAAARSTHNHPPIRLW